MNKINLKRFGFQLKKEIMAFSYISKIPLIGAIWEERVYEALKELGIKNIKWLIGSHGSGSDIETNEYKFSIKSQKSTKNFSISSFRTTSHKTLEDKIKFIFNEGKNFTHYLILSRKYFKNKIVYKVYLIDVDIMSEEEFALPWQETYSKGALSGWTSGWRNGIRLEIRKQMSDQLWIFINEEKLNNCKYIKLLTNVEIFKGKMGYLWKKIKGRILNA